MSDKQAVEEPKEKPRGAVTEEDLAVAFSGPAPIANRFFITTTAHGVRIAFAEQSAPGKILSFRTAVALGVEDAISLYKLLQGMLKEVEAELERFEQESAESNSTADNG